MRNTGWTLLLLASVSLPAGVTTTARAAEPQVTPVAALSKAKEQLTIALKHAELSLGPHKPGSGWTRIHMQHVLNILEGKDGADYQKKVENPGDGYGVVRYLKDANALVAPDGEAAQGIEFTFAYLEEAVEHANHALRAPTVKAIHHNAGLVAGMLSAALGRPDSESPVTGTLAFAINALGRSRP
ncbi:MAG TPA: hypothetical protein VGJ57_03295 [Nitrospirales bacterium]|jgi:hypothetical protein